MTQEKFNQAELLLKRIAFYKSKLDTFKRFTKHPNITEVRLATPQDGTLTHRLEDDELENVIAYLKAKYLNKLNSLEEEFENL